MIAESGFLWAVLAVLLGYGTVWLVPFVPWLRARSAGAPVGLRQLVAMRLRKVDVGRVIEAYGVSWLTGCGPLDTATPPRLASPSRSATSARGTAIGPRPASKEGLRLDLNRLEAHYLAGGKVDAVADAAAVAHAAGLDLNFDQICALDLEGRDVRAEVMTMAVRKVAERIQNAQAKLQ